MNPYPLQQLQEVVPVKRSVAFDRRDLHAMDPFGARAEQLALHSLDVALQEVDIPILEWLEDLREGDGVDYLDHGQPAGTRRTRHSEAELPVTAHDGKRPRFPGDSGLHDGRPVDIRREVSAKDSCVTRLWLDRDELSAREPPQKPPGGDTGCSHPDRRSTEALHRALWRRVRTTWRPRPATGR